MLSKYDGLAKLTGFSIAVRLIPALHLQPYGQYVVHVSCKLAENAQRVNIKPYDSISTNC